MSARASAAAGATERLRLYLLECAAGSCSSLSELGPSLLALMPGTGDRERRGRLADEVSTMSRDGLLRVHRAFRCTEGERAPSGADLTPEEIGALPADAFTPQARRSYFVCATPRTSAALRVFNAPADEHARRPRAARDGARKR